jgi:hypothetical protein
MKTKLCNHLLACSVALVLEDLRGIPNEDQQGRYEQSWEELDDHSIWRDR